MNKNINKEVVEDFGNEWEIYNHKNHEKILIESFKQYFDLMPKKYLHKNAVGFDAGCGSGRWAKFIAPKVKHLYCIDASNKAIEVAKENLSDIKNCSYECTSINTTILKNESMDFGYCLGVLHHLPKTKEALSCCISKLKRGAPLLIYIYYSFDNKPSWFKLIWKVSDFGRRIISRMPFSLKLIISRLIAIFIYVPFAKISLILDKLGFDVSNIPLSDFRRKDLYIIFTDALDRFGTKLEKRFSKEEIYIMMDELGLKSIKFSNKTPYWVAIGYRR